MFLVRYFAMIPRIDFGLWAPITSVAAISATGLQSLACFNVYSRMLDPSSGMIRGSSDISSLIRIIVAVFGAGALWVLPAITSTSGSWSIALVVSFSWLIECSILLCYAGRIRTGDLKCMILASCPLLYGVVINRSAILFADLLSSASRLSGSCFFVLLIQFSVCTREYGKGHICKVSFFLAVSFFVGDTRFPDF